MRSLVVMTMLCVCAFGARAEAPPGTITTHATARTHLPNTVADVTIGIEAHARTVGAVHKTLADRSASLLAYLRAQGTERLRTEQVAVTPDTETDRGRGLPDRITGYSGRLRVAFRVSAETLPQALAGVLDNGGNSLDDTTIRPRETEMDAARQQLAAVAVRVAMAQAAAVAQAAGRRLGAVHQIMVDPGLGLAPRAAPMFAPRVAMAAAPAPIATEAGDSEMAATVSLVVDLIEP